jgi:hypothetical protein
MLFLHPSEFFSQVLFRLLDFHDLEKLLYHLYGHVLISHVTLFAKLDTSHLALRVGIVRNISFSIYSKSHSKVNNNLLYNKNLLLGILFLNIGYNGQV